MANIISLFGEIASPTGLWPKLFDFFESWLSNYGWTIVMFTLSVKLLVSPLDFYNRYSTRKNTLIQKRLSGQVQKINQKYQNNREEANRQVSLLYKREGYNMVGSCIFMLTNLVLTLVIFFSFFNSLRTISTYKMLNQYEELRTTYYSTLEISSTEDAEQQTLEKFQEINKQNNWLWINNIWRNDAKVNSIPSLEDLQKSSTKNSKYKEYVENINPTEYDTIIKVIESENKEYNGYYILAVLVVVSTYLSQFLSEKMNDTKTKQQSQDIQTNSTMKLMKLILPITMLIFVLTNTASFGIYILVGNLFGIITNIVFGYIVKKMTKKEEEKLNIYLEKESIKNLKKPGSPHMVNYKNIGDRL